VKEAGPSAPASFPSPLTMQPFGAALGLATLTGDGEADGVGLARVGVVEARMTVWLIVSGFWGEVGLRWLPLQAKVNTRNVTNSAIIKTIFRIGHLSYRASMELRYTSRKFSQRMKFDNSILVLRNRPIKQHF